MKINTISTGLGAGALLLAAGPALAQSSAAQPWQSRMGDPIPDLGAALLDRFVKGQDEFDHVLMISEGLGPIMNDSSCGQCHSHPAVGGGSTTFVTRFGKAAQGGFPFDPLASLGGSLRQDESIDPAIFEVVPPEADVTTARLTPIACGAGLLEAIDDADIVANASLVHPFVNGFVRMATPAEVGVARPGRFGWKGGVASVLTFSADASLNEMGLTNRFFGVENAPNGDTALLAAWDSVADPEDGPDMQGFDRIDRQTDFQRLLAAPPQTPRTGMAGEAIFDTVGCGACHLTGGYTTNSGALGMLDGQFIKPYSDFLLHDMGTLGDGIVDGPATEQIMQTRALWGLSQRASFLHDGRATGGTFFDNVNMAIADHDGEAAFARTNWNNLGASQQNQLVAFLGSLGRAEFDWDINNRIDEFDWFFIEPLFTGPGAGGTPDDPAAVADLDQDGDFDLVDFGNLQRAWTGQ